MREIDSPRVHEQRRQIYALWTRGMQGGYLTRDTIASIRPLLPALDRAPDPDRVTPGELFSLLTVETLCLMIQRRLSI